jgi:hypothetical protein
MEYTNDSTASSLH